MEENKQKKTAEPVQSTQRLSLLLNKTREGQIDPETLKNLAGTSRDGIAVLDGEGKLIYGNESFFKMTGLPEMGSADELRRFFGDNLIVPLNSVEGKTSMQLERTIINSDGVRKNVLISRYLFQGADHELKNSLYVFADAREKDAIKSKLKTYISAVSQIADAVMIASPDGIIEYVNPAFEKLTGYSMSEVVGKNPRILKSGMQSRKFYENMWNTILRGEVFRATLINRTKYGRLYYSEKTISPVIDNNQIIYFVSTDRDVTERIEFEKKLRKSHHDIFRLMKEKSLIQGKERAAQKLLKKSETIFQAIFDYAYQYMALLDLDGRVLEINRASLELLRTRKDDVLGKCFWDTELWHLTPQLQERMKESIKKAARGELVRHEEEIKDLNGDDIFLDFSIKPIMGEDGKVDHLLTEARNITRRKREQEEVNLLHWIAEHRDSEQHELEDIMQVFLKKVCRLFGWIGGQAWMGNNSSIKNLSYYSENSLAAEFAKKAAEIIHETAWKRTTMPGLVMKRKRPLWVENMGEENFARSSLAKKYGIKTFLVIPVFLTGENVIVMEFFQEKITSENKELEEKIRLWSEQLASVFYERITHRQMDELKKQMELILNSTGEGIYGLDKNHNITFINPFAAKVLEWTQEELIGQNAHDAFHHSRPDGTPLPQEECPVFRMVQGTRTDFYEDDDIYWTKTGKKLPVEYVSTPIWEGDNLVGAVVSFKDITERKQLETAKDDFVSTATHELRTPLTVLQGYLSLLDAERELLNSKQCNYLDRIWRASNKLQRIVENLLSVIRIEGKPKLEFRTFEITSLVQEIVSDFIVKAELESKTLLFNPKGVYTVRGDSEYIKKILVNLLENALKYTFENGKISLDCHVLRDEMENELVISVEDDGVGVPEDEMGKIFQKFYRVANPLSVKAGGTGLGLYITKKLVEIQGGRIWTEQTGSTGIRFCFTLPLVKDEKQLTLIN